MVLVVCSFGTVGEREMGGESAHALGERGGEFERKEKKRSSRHCFM